MKKFYFLTASIMVIGAACLFGTTNGSSSVINELYDSNLNTLYLFYEPSTLMTR